MNNILKAIGASIASIVIIIFMFGSWGSIPAGHTGVKTTFGAVSPNHISEGLYFKWPFVQKVNMVTIQVQKAEAVASSASSDLQSVKATVVVNYINIDSATPKLYQQFGERFADTIITPAIQESVKKVSAGFSAEQLITQRAELSEKISDSIRDKVSQYGLVTITDISITNLDFSQAFDDAVERKVTAEQNALEAKNKLEQIKYEAQQKIEAAKGEAEAIRITSTALTEQPQYLELKSIEKWDGKLPVYTGNGVVPFINLDK
jgi:prohibitin 2